MTLMKGFLLRHWVKVTMRVMVSMGYLFISSQTKLNDERVGKMKFLQSTGVRLLEGGDEFLVILAEADEFTEKVHYLEGDF